MTTKSIKINDVPIVRETDVFIVEYASLGLTSKEIAERLKKDNSIDLGYKAVEERLMNLRKLFDCANTPHLIGKFFRNNLIK